MISTIVGHTADIGASYVYGVVLSALLGATPISEAVKAVESERAHYEASFTPNLYQVSSLVTFKYSDEGLPKEVIKKMDLLAIETGLNQEDLQILKELYRTNYAPVLINLNTLSSVGEGMCR